MPIGEFQQSIRGHSLWKAESIFDLLNMESYFSILIRVNFWKWKMHIDFKKDYIWSGDGIIIFVVFLWMFLYPKIWSLHALEKSLEAKKNLVCILFPVIAITNNWSHTQITCSLRAIGAAEYFLDSAPIAIGPCRACWKPSSIDAPSTIVHHATRIGNQQ